MTWLVKLDRMHSQIIQRWKKVQMFISMLKMMSYPVVRIYLYAEKWSHFISEIFPLWGRGDVREKKNSESNGKWRVRSKCSGRFHWQSQREPQCPFQVRIPNSMYFSPSGPRCFSHRNLNWMSVHLRVTLSHALIFKCIYSNTPFTVSLYCLYYIQK